MEIERRFYADTPEVRATDDDGKKVLRGTGIVFNSWSEDLGGFREMILPEAVDGIFDDADVRSFFNHDPSYILGRTKSGTMRLDVKKAGVGYEVDLPSSRSDVHESVARGDVDGSSFMFTVADGGDTWTSRGGVLERKVHKFGNVFEMGPVSMPAYRKATVSARALAHVRSTEVAEPEVVTPPADPQPDPAIAVELEHLKLAVGLIEAEL